jgi:16S rRNA (uracil1498-N3)-methyltransferase
MSFPFFYLESINDNETVYSLPEDTARHIVQVLRMKIGENIQLTDGRGTLLTTEIIETGKKNCVVKKTTVQYFPLPIKKITIAISLIKNNNRLEWFLEKSTEIGVYKIIPMLCHRTEKQHFRLDRMKSILISAMLQSKQVWLPELCEPIPIKRIISNEAASAKLIAHCELDNKQNLVELKNQNTSIILIGPEGDFTTEEIEQCKAAGYLPVSLGENRLRTETAGLVAVTLLNS